MNSITVPCDTGKVSDGYHTFDELYEHRCALFLALMKAHRELSWFSQIHHDNTAMEGWFIAGIALPTGQVTYHLPDKLWNIASLTGAKSLIRGVEWDGHTSADVVTRLTLWAKEAD